MLEGKNVLLRPIKKSDASFFLKWINDPKITENLLVYLPVNEISEEKWIENVCQSKNDAIFVIEEKLENGESRPIGNCGIHQIDWKDSHGTFGIFIGEKDLHGKGYGTQALTLLLDYVFLQLNLNRVNSSVLAFNEKSLGLHKKVGFAVEGRARKKIYKNGEFHDEVMLGILKEEWLRTR